MNSPAVVVVAALSPYIVALLAAVPTAIATIMVGYYSYLGQLATKAVTLKQTQIEADRQEVEEDRADVEKNAAVVAGFESLLAQLQAQNTAMSEQLAVSRQLLRQAYDEADECSVVLSALRREVGNLRELLAAAGIEIDS